MPSAIGAERIAHRDLGLACRGLAKQQVRDVRARDQQQHRDRDLQQHDQRPHVADDLLVQRHDARAKAGIGRRIALATATTSRSSAAPAPARASIPCASRPTTAMMCESRTAVRSPANGKLRGMPRSPVIQTSPPATICMSNDRGSTPTMVCGIPLRIMRLAERVGRSAEALMPQAIGQHRHLRRVGAIIVRRHDAADLRLDAEHVEEVAGGRDRVNALRFAQAGQRRREIVEGGQAARTPWFRRRQSMKFAGATARFGLSARVSHTTIRLAGSRIGQRPQHAAVQHRENGGVGANAKGQRNDRRERQQRMTEAQPEGESKVGHEGSDEWPQDRLACRRHVASVKIRRNGTRAVTSWRLQCKNPRHV